MTRAAVTPSTPRLPAIGAVGAGGSAMTAQQVSQAQAAGLFGAEGWNPLAWPGQILDELPDPGDVAGAPARALWGQVQPFLITGMFALGGIALIVAGANGIVRGSETFKQVDGAVKAVATKGATA